MRTTTGLLFLLILAAGCTGPRAGDNGAIEIGDAWVRSAAAGATSAAYLRISNGTDGSDTLVGVSTPAAATASIHQTMTDEGGMTGMHEATLTIPAGETVALAPGGYHVMLTKLAADLEPGSEIQLTLTFERAGPLVVTAQVRGG